MIGGLSHASRRSSRTINALELAVAPVTGFGCQPGNVVRGRCHHPAADIDVNGTYRLPELRPSSGACRSHENVVVPQQHSSHEQSAGAAFVPATLVAQTYSRGT